MIRSQGLLLLCILAAAALLPSTASQGAEEPSLYLLPPQDDLWRFTTFAPEDAPPTLVEPRYVVVPRFMWTWSLTRSPTAWALSPEDRVEATVYLEGLDRVVPVTEPYADPQELGKIKVQVDLFIAGNTTSDSAILQYLIDPSSKGNASGEVMLDPRPLSAGLEEIRVGLEVAEGIVVANSSDVAVRITVTGVTSAKERPRVAVAGPDAPSRILVSSYPWQELHDQERADLERRACLERILKKESCTEAPVVETPAEAAESPGAVLPLVLLTLVSVAFSIRHRGRTKRP